MSHRKAVGAAIVALAGIAIGALGQAGASFDVASIKANNSGTGFLRIGGQPADGRFVATNATVEMLMDWAYRVQNYQVAGGPGWMRSDTFDIEARSDLRPLTPEQMVQMVQSLLADRFQLKMHRDTAEGSVYALAVGKSGIKMKRSADQTPSHGGRMAPGFVGVNGVSMGMLVRMFSGQLGRPVVDRTNLEGFFDISLEWATDPSFGGPGPGGVRGPDAGVSATGPSLFTAVEEQLGLKLESTKGPVEMLVIESIQRPSQN